MSRSEPLTGARGQIVWILALVISTAVIIHLERLDLGPSPAPRADAATLARSQTLLDQAQARFAAAPADPEAAASLLVALSLATKNGALDQAAARERAAAILPLAATAGAAWQPALALADLGLPAPAN